MIFNDTVSILDTAEDDNGDLRIIQYVLRGVYLEASVGSKLNESGEVKTAARQSYLCTLFIPSNFSCTEHYVDSKTWEALSFAEKLNAFTLRPSQLIVGTDSSLEYNSMDEVMNNEDLCYRVIGVDYFNKVLPHFEVYGK